MLTFLSAVLKAGKMSSHERLISLYLGVEGHPYL